MAKHNTQIAVLSKREARDLCDRIVERAEDLRDMLKRLRDEKGWMALGYETWADCCETEFGYSKQHANRLIKAVEIGQQVEPIGSTLPESHARELGKVPEERREEVLAKATEEADGKPLTAKVIKAAACEITEPDDQDDVIDCESELDEVEREQEEFRIKWLREAAAELHATAKNPVTMADLLSCIAVMVRDKEAAVVAAILENIANGL